MQQTHEAKLQTLLLTRGSIAELSDELNKFRVTTRDPIQLEPMENNLPENDIGFNINLGKIDDTYFDYEVFVLPTRVPNNYIITEITGF